MKMKIDVDFEIFGILAFYSAILLLKVLLMPLLVARTRMNKKVSQNEHCDDGVGGSDAPSAEPSASSAEVLQAYLY